jgi:hypothetical protein
MQDVVPVFRVSSGDSIFDAKLPVAESKTDGTRSHRFSLRLRCVDSISDRKTGDDARIYTIGTEMSNLFGAVRRVFGGRGVEHNGRASGANAESSEGLCYSLKIMTSVDFTRAATVWPFFKRISPTASAVMMDVIRPSEVSCGF